MIQIIGPFLNRTHRIEHSKNMTHRIGPSLKNMTHRIWTLLFNMSQRKWHHFWSWLKEYFFLHIWLKEQWSFWEIMTQRIELFFFLKKHNDSKNWTFSKNLRIDPSLPIWLTPRIQAFWTFSYDSKNWTLFLEYDSKNWTCFKMTQRIEPCLKITQRI